MRVVIGLCGTHGTGKSTILKGARELGFTVNDQSTPIRQDAFWLGEAQGRVVVSVSKEKLSVLKEKLNAAGQSFLELGTVSTSINVNSLDWGNISDWKEKYDTAIEKYLK